MFCVGFTVFSKLRGWFALPKRFLQEEQRQIILTLDLVWMFLESETKLFNPPPPPQQPTAKFYWIFNIVLLRGEIQQN